MMKAKPWSGGGKEGLHIWCPGCDGVHGVRTNPPGWTWNGSLEKPTLQPSLLTTYGSKEGSVCHCYVTDGMIKFLDDSTHALKGQTVELPDWPYDGSTREENAHDIIG